MTRDKARTLLHKHLNAALRRLGKPVEHSDVDGDDAEIAAGVGEMELSAGVRALTEESVRQCRAALERLDLDAYGRCLDCGAAIPDTRLRVVPEAETCIQCAITRESARLARRASDWQADEDEA